MPKPNLNPGSKSLSSLKDLNSLFKEALLTSNKEERTGISYWYREQKALILSFNGELTGKPKCKLCRGRGRYLQAVPKKSGKITDKDFKPHACECLITQLELPDTEAFHKEALREKAERDAKALPAAGTIKKSSKSSTGNGPGTPKQPSKKARKNEKTPGNSGGDPKGEKTGSPTKTVRKRKTPDKGDL